MNTDGRESEIFPVQGVPQHVICYPKAGLLVHGCDRKANRRPAEIPTKEPPKRRIMSMPSCIIPAVGHENTLLAVGLKQAVAEHKQIKWLRQRSDQAGTASCSDLHRLLRQINQLKRGTLHTTSIFRTKPY